MLVSMPLEVCSTFDAWELKDILAGHPREVAELRAKLTSWETETAAPRPHGVQAAAQ